MTMTGYNSIDISNKCDISHKCEPGYIKRLFLILVRQGNTMPSQQVLPGDAELVAQLARDDNDGFSTLSNRYWEDAFNAAYRRLNDFEQSRDIVQNVFVSLWDRRGKVHIGNFRSYLLTAIKFQVIRYSTQHP